MSKSTAFHSWADQVPPAAHLWVEAWPCAGTDGRWEEMGMAAVKSRRPKKGQTFDPAAVFKTFAYRSWTKHPAIIRPIGFKTPTFGSFLVAARLQLVESSPSSFLVLRWWKECPWFLIETSIPITAFSSSMISWARRYCNVGSHWPSWPVASLGKGGI